jgi:regulatory protein
MWKSPRCAIGRAINRRSPGISPLRADIASRGLRLSDYGLFAFVGIMGIVTALEVGKRNTARVNVYLDGEFAFSIQIDAAARLHKGQTLSDDTIAALKASDHLARAIDSASRHLAARPRSVHEIRKHLESKAYDDPTIEQALDKLQTLGYLDDQAFAAYWVQQRTTFKPLGEKALRYELREKGISDAIIRELLAEVDTDDAAFRAAHAHARKLRGVTRKVFRQKLGMFLARRGFGYGDADRAARRLIDEIDAETPDFFASDTDVGRMRVDPDE